MCCALVLLALVDNTDGIGATITNGDRTSNFINMRTWAEREVGSDVRLFAESPEKIAELLALSLAVAPEQSGDTTIDGTFVSYHFTRYGEDGEVISMYSAPYYVNAEKERVKH